MTFSQLCLHTLYGVKGKAPRSELSDFMHFTHGCLQRFDRFSMAEHRGCFNPVRFGHGWQKGNSPSLLEEKAPKNILERENILEGKKKKKKTTEIVLLFRAFQTL